MNSLNSKYLFVEFLEISKILNTKLNIIPVLYGSLGLQKISGLEFFPEDIDILIPLKYIEEKWTLFQSTIEELGYEFVDLREHEFRKKDIKIAFSHEEDLDKFADVKHRNLKIVHDNGISFKSLSVEDYLKVYKKSMLDGYRREKKNNKDLVKIKTIEKLLLNTH